jgi:hypothetical protein
VLLSSLIDVPPSPSDLMIGLFFARTRATIEGWMRLLLRLLGPGSEGPSHWPGHSVCRSFKVAASVRRERTMLLPD